MRSSLPQPRHDGQGQQTSGAGHGWPRHCSATLRDLAECALGSLASAAASASSRRTIEPPWCASELRATAASHRGALATAGLRMALRDGKAQEVHWWAERGRATVREPRSLRPPADEALADLLQGLRTTMAGERGGQNLRSGHGRLGGPAGGA